MSYGTCESTGKKAIGLDQDKRKNKGGGRVKQANPKAKRVYTPPTPTPTRGFDGRINPIPPPLQANWTNLLTHMFIYIKKAIPEGETHAHSWNRSLATNSSELRPVLHERALGIGYRQSVDTSLILSQQHTFCLFKFLLLCCPCSNF